MNNWRLYELHKELAECIMDKIAETVSTGNIRKIRLGEKWGILNFSENNILLEDPSGLRWTEALIPGKTFLGFPVGEECRLLVVEICVFCLVLRYQGSVYVGALVGFAISHLYLGLRNSIYKGVIARSTGIDQRFLL